MQYKEASRCATAITLLDRKWYPRGKTGPRATELTRVAARGTRACYRDHTTRPEILSKV